MAAKRKGDWPTVVMVDDDREHLRAVSDYLEGEGQVRVMATVYDAQAGLAAARAIAPDVVLLDINMPGMDPWNACGGITNMTESKVLMYTGGYATSYVDLCRRHGGSGVLSKNEPFETVGDACRAVLRGEEYFSNVFFSRLTELYNGATISPVATLTDREREILRRWVEGHSAPLIAEELSTQKSSIYRSLQSAREKLNADNDAELGAIAIAEGIVSPKVLGQV